VQGELARARDVLVQALQAKRGSPSANLEATRRPLITVLLR
jgi:hypothetical protein